MRYSLTQVVGVILLVALTLGLPAYAGLLGGGGGAMSASSILTALLGVDTDDSGLNADTIDGLEGTSLITTSTTANTTSVTMNVAGTDYTCTSGSVCRFGSSGAADAEIVLGQDVLDLVSSGGSERMRIWIQNASSHIGGMFLIDGTSAMGFTSTGPSIGTRLAVTETDRVAGFAKGHGSDGSRTDLFTVYGEAALRVVPGTALAISGTPDSTRTPVSTGTACRFAAASGSQTWRPSETGAVDGMFFCCTNTGANSVTMSESAGVYEGTAAVVGQWDQICMEYVTDRWVQRSFMDN